MQTKFKANHQKKYCTNKTDVYHIDDIWSLKSLDLKDYGPENNRNYRFVSVTIDKFSKYIWAVPLKNKNSQIVKDSFENFFIGSKRKLNLIETDRGKEFYNSIFQNSLNNNNIKHYSRKSSFGAVFPERFKQSIRGLLKKPVFEKEMVIGLIYYPKQRNNITIEYILLLK